MSQTLDSSQLSVKEAKAITVVFCIFVILFYSNLWLSKTSRDWETFLDYLILCKMMTNLTIEAKSKQSNCFYEWICFQQVIVSYCFFLLFSPLFTSLFPTVLYNVAFLTISHGEQSWDSLCKMELGSSEILDTDFIYLSWVQQGNLELVQKGKLTWNSVWFWGFYL